MRRNSPTGQWWQYPLRAPSFRFKQVNNFIRSLAVQFDELDDDEKRDWKNAAEKWFWFAQCVPWVFEYDPLKEDAPTAIAAYQGVNAANLLNSLTVVRRPPLETIIKDGDTIIADTSGFRAIRWFGRSTAPSGEFMAHVRGKTAMHEPESGPALQKYTWGMAIPINYNDSTSIASIVDSVPGAETMPFLSVAVTIMQKGSAPFIGQRIGFSPF